MFFVKDKTLFLSGFAMLFLSIGFSISACKKNKLEYKIEGVISDKSLNSPLNGAMVTLYVTEIGAASQIQIASMTTGSDGKYAFSFKREKYEAITIKVTKNLYFDQEISASLDDLNIKNSNVFNFDVYAKSWARVHIVGNGINDCRIIRQEGYSGCAECCPTGYQYFNTPTDTSIYCINKGNTLYQVYYNVLQTPTQGPVGITTVPFDTTELLISY